MNESMNPFTWIYNPIADYTPSIVTSSFSSLNNYYEPRIYVVSSHDKQNRQKEFVRWFALTNYEERRLFTENYSCLSKRNQANYRN